MSKYKKTLIAKLRRQIEFKKAQNDNVAVELLENKILEIQLQMKEKEERKEKIKHLSDPPEFAHIAKVTELYKCVHTVIIETPKAAYNKPVLAFNVWSKQNPNLREYYTSFVDFAKALVEGHYVDYEDIMEAREKVLTDYPELKNQQNG